LARPLQNKDIGNKEPDMTKESFELHRCILYYPTISIPTGTWLRQSILYWDEVGSIVPHSYTNEALIPYSLDIQYLKSEGLFRPFLPAESIFKQKFNKVEEFEEEFLAILHSPKFQKILPPRPNKENGSKPITKSLLLLLAESEPYSRIHEDKISHRLYSILKEEGLAYSPQGEWHFFEKNTALLYMAVLAKHIADGDIHSTVIGTDIASYQNFIFEAMENSEGVACLATNFWKALPVPRDNVPLSNIVEFKRKRKDELLNFRQTLDDLQSEIKKCENQADVQQVLVKFKEKSDRSLANLEAVLSDSRIATFAGSIRTLIKLDSPALWATLGVAVNQATKITDIPIQWTLAGASILGAIEIFSYLTDKRNEKRATLRNEPFSYLAYAKKEGLV
jgi:hypothetical protein